MAYVVTECRNDGRELHEFGEQLLRSFGVAEHIGRLHDCNAMVVVMEWVVALIVLALQLHQEVEQLRNRYLEDLQEIAANENRIDHALLLG
jgi:hypothetical protein